MKQLTYFPILDGDYWSIKKRKKLDRVNDFIGKELATVMTLAKSPKDADLVVVWWGDGFILQIMRKYKDLNTAFFWINAWTKWFLMNHIENIDTMPQSFKEFELVEIPVIPVTTRLKNWQEETGFYLNEALLWWHVSDFFNFKVSLESKEIIIPWSWLVVNTPTWSTWYAANLKQPILDLASNMQWLAWICTQWFDYWYLEPQKIDISDSRWRDTLDLILDWKHWMVFSDIDSLTVHPSTQKITIAFTKEQNFQDRRVLLAQESNWNVIK